MMTTGHLSMALAVLAVPLLDSTGRAQTRMTPATPEERIAALEQSVGGRLGVAVLDTGGGKRIDHRADERFPMCSTFKLPLAAQVLARVDAKKERLDRILTYGEKDLLDWAPVAREHVKEGRLSVEALCAAAVTHSDNTAANLLLATVGGPAGLTSYLRSLGDSVTRLDRTEPELNTAIAGDERDTTTPAAMLADVNALVLGDALSPESRERLTKWLVGNTTGDNRLRAGLPAGWRVGDKTGSGQNGATNDVAVIWPPGRPPILVVVYAVESKAPRADIEKAIAVVGRIVAEGW
jgi:beta-lactamase class A